MWSDEKIGFALEPLHRGYVFAAPVQINVVENGQARRLVYDRSAFEFGKLQPPADLPDIGFSGVRVLRSGDDQGWRELAIFQGATFFRSMARGQTYGLNARGLSIRTGEAQGEEFPQFRSLWIEKPSPAADALTIHALLDSASLTGAFQFTLRPGDATIIDTELTLVARVAVDRLGLSPMTSIFVFGPLDHRRPDDTRAAAYDIGGLQMLTGANEWLWRPIASRETLQISAFADKNPRGFGLLQRARGLRRVLRRRRALGAQAVAVDRADRRLGRGRGDPARNPLRFRVQRQRHRPMAAEGEPRRRRVDLVRLSPVLVLVAAGASRRSPPPSTRAAARPASAGASPSNSSRTCSPTRRRRRR